MSQKMSFVHVRHGTYEAIALSDKEKPKLREL